MGNLNWSKNNINRRLQVEAVSHWRKEDHERALRKAARKAKIKAEKKAQSVVSDGGKKKKKRLPYKEWLKTLTQEQKATYFSKKREREKKPQDQAYIDHLRYHGLM